MPIEIREHVAITDKLLAQHRYASRRFFVGTAMRRHHLSRTV
jgi:hypothetical protein